MENTDKTKILFCNIGWMRDYEGIQGDSITGGGAYVDEHGTGFEVCNFLEIEGQVYGYVRTKNDSDTNKGAPIALERITAREKEGKDVSGVTIVWTATHLSGGRVIVGWYNNATVYRAPEEIESPTNLQKDNDISYYKILASASDARLLRPEERNFYIKRWSQSSIWYAAEPEDKNTVSEVMQYIKFYNEGIVLQVLDADMSASEGNPQIVSHIRRERSPKLVKAKKEAVLKKENKLCCEVCGFDFAATYGELGDGFCEVHHLKQLSESDGEVETKLEDLAIVCSNCHRIIHRQDPMLTIEKLKEEIAKVDSA